LPQGGRRIPPRRHPLLTGGLSRPPRTPLPPLGVTSPPGPPRGKGLGVARRSTIRAAASCTFARHCPAAGPATTARGLPYRTWRAHRRFPPAARSALFLPWGGQGCFRARASITSRLLLPFGRPSLASWSGQFSPRNEPTACGRALFAMAGRTPGNSLISSSSTDPFPAADDPLASARQRALAARGGKRVHDRLTAFATPPCYWPMAPSPAVLRFRGR